MLGAVTLEDRAVDVGLLAPPDRAGLAIVAVHLGATQDPASERAGVRDSVAAGVEAATAPRVVGMPGVRVEHVQRVGPSGIVRSTAHDEAGVGDVAACRRALRGERDEMETRLPVIVDRELDRRRPTAPGRVGVGGRFDERALDVGGAPTNLASCTPPFDRDVEACGAGGDVEGDRVAGPVAESTGVPLDVVVEGLVVSHPQNLAIAGDTPFALRFRRDGSPETQHKRECHWSLASPGSSAHDAGMDDSMIIERFKALGDPVRLTIVRELRHGRRCACELADHANVTPPLLSHHLKVLREAGLVTGTKRGRWIDYDLDHDAVDELLAGFAESR